MAQWSLYVGKGETIRFQAEPEVKRGQGGVMVTGIDDKGAKRIIASTNPNSLECKQVRS